MADTRHPCLTDVHTRGVCTCDEFTEMGTPSRAAPQSWPQTSGTSRSPLSPLHHVCSFLSAPKTQPPSDFDARSSIADSDSLLLRRLSRPVTSPPPSPRPPAGTVHRGLCVGLFQILHVSGIVPCRSSGAGLSHCPPHSSTLSQTAGFPPHGKSSSNN